MISLPAVLTPHSSSTTFTSSSTTLTSSSTYELARIKSSTSATTTALTWLCRLFLLLFDFFVRVIVLLSCLFGLLAFMFYDLTVFITLTNNFAIGISHANNFTISIALYRLLSFCSLLGCLWLSCLSTGCPNICSRCKRWLVFHFFDHAQNCKILRQLVHVLLSINSVIDSAVWALNHLGSLPQCFEALFTISVPTRQVARHDWIWVPDLHANSTLHFRTLSCWLSFKVLFF